MPSPALRSSFMALVKRTDGMNRLRSKRQAVVLAALPASSSTSTLSSTISTSPEMPGQMPASAEALAEKGVQQMKESGCTKGLEFLYTMDPIREYGAQQLQELGCMRALSLCAQWTPSTSRASSKWKSSVVEGPGGPRRCVWRPAVARIWLHGTP